MWQYNQTSEIYHDTTGMHWKWGQGKSSNRPGYRSTGIGAALARKSNEKVDKGFKNWGENTKKRDSAIDLGKQATAAKLAYEKNKSDKTLKADYEQKNKAYKKALRENTTYRKGVVRQEVGRDESRKYLSEAKRVAKELDRDPSNKGLQKQYNDLMSNHDVARAKARRAVDVATKRSRKIASLKRARTLAVKAAVASAVIAGGTVAVNAYLKKNGKAGIGEQTVRSAMEFGKQVMDAAGYIYH